MAKTSEIKISLDHNFVRELLKDPQFAVEIKGAVIESALKGNIERIISDDFTQMIRLRVNEITQEQIGIVKGYPLRVTLDKRIEDDIKAKTECSLYAAVEDIISKKTEGVLSSAFDGNLEQYINERIEARVTGHINEVIDYKVKEAINKVLEGLKIK